MLSDTSLQLPEFSYAGYAWGERPLPVYGATLDVTDFGATGDDMADDTEAFLRALEAAHERSGLVVLAIPEGRFHLSGIMFLERDSLVVRGSGPDKTVIFVEKPLGVLEAPEALAQGGEAALVQGRRPSMYSDWGAVFWSRAPTVSSLRQGIPILAGGRGQHELRIRTDASTDLTGYFGIAWMSGGIESGFGRESIQDVTVIGRDGNVLTIKEPLAADLAPESKARLKPVSRLTEVGIEHLSIEFEQVPYGGHGLEDGFNAIFFSNLRHGWVRNVEIRNADSAILLSGSSQVTLEDISIRGRSGHIGVQLKSTAHSVVRNVRILSSFEHSLSCIGSSAYNVFTRAQATNLHDIASGNANLYDQLTLRAAKGPVWHLAAGSRPVFWHVQVEFAGLHEMRVPAYLGALGPGAMAVALGGNVPVRLSAPKGAHIEGTNVPGLAVSSLYRLQADQRLIRAH